MTKIPSIGPLRGLAAFLVLISHVAFWSGAGSSDGAGRLFARGDAGVAVFFALSAFLLTYQADGHGQLGLKAYWIRRLGRIVPGYWVAFIAVLAVATTLGELGGWRKVAAHIVLIQGLTGDAYQGFSQTWSLTTEMTFYALVPLIGYWLRHIRDDARFGPLPSLVVVSTGSLAIQTACASSGDASLAWISTSVVGHATWFCVGIQLAWWHARGRRVALSTGRLAGLAVGVYLLAATPLAGPTDLGVPSATEAFAKELLYAIFAGLLLCAAVSGSEAVQRACRARSPQFSGDISYGVFLWHVLVIQVLFHALGLRLFQVSFLLVLIPTLVFSTLLAWLSWQLVERPAIRWSRKVGSAPRR